MATKTYLVPSMLASAVAQVAVAPSLYFRVTSAGYACTIRLRSEYEQLAELSNWSAGLAIGPLPKPYTIVEFTNGGTAQAVEFIASDAPIEDNRLVGTVNITGGLNTKANLADTVSYTIGTATTAAGGVTVLAANANRAGATIQVNGSNNVYLQSGSFVPTTSGILIVAGTPGDSYEVQHKGEVRAATTSGVCELRIEERSFT